jgi:serine O-acetyltransferase
MNLLIFKPNKEIFLSFLKKRFLNFEINYNDIEIFLEELFNNLIDKFKYINNKYYNENNNIILNTAHYSQLVLILLELNSIIYNNYLINKNENLLELCNKIYFMNVTQSSCDLFYEINFPKKIYCDHPLGSVIGRAKFSKTSSLVFSRGCNIGQNWNIYPEIEGDLIMYSNSVLLGKTVIKGLVILSYGSYIKDAGILENVLIFGKSPNIIIKKLKDNDFNKYKFF